MTAHATRPIQPNDRVFLGHFVYLRAQRRICWDNPTSPVKWNLSVRPGFDEKMDICIRMVVSMLSCLTNGTHSLTNPQRVSTKWQGKWITTPTTQRIKGGRY